MRRPSLGRRAGRLGLATLGVSALAAAASATPIVPAPAATAATPNCVAAGATGLTAAAVVTSNLNGATINAAGCDLGIYVPPGTSGITISGVSVTGANDHGILVQDASDITIEDSTVTGNGTDRNPAIDEDKAIELVGTTGSTVTGNTVDNNLSGGIGIADDGPRLDPAAPQPSAKAPMASTNDVISDNHVFDNYTGCAIVVASYLPGAGISHITISGNTVTGSPGKFGPHGPVVGPVVVATDAPATSVSDVSLTDNVITGSLLAGITVPANAPHDSLTGTTITGNTLIANNWGDANGAPRTDAIALEINVMPPSIAPVLEGTTIDDNTMTGQYAGVWETPSVTGTTLSGNHFAGPVGARLFYRAPVPGAGYWMAGRMGGVFTFGDAPFYGSLPGLGIHPLAPISAAAGVGTTIIPAG
jgi:nitrous oxidase accessory protein NosD